METSVDKCLAFCQSLAMSGQKFSFTLSIGKDNFSFSNKELGSSSCVKKKKKSPSQVRREQRRKEEHSKDKYKDNDNDNDNDNNKYIWGTPSISDPRDF